MRLRECADKQSRDMDKYAKLYIGASRDERSGVLHVRHGWVAVPTPRYSTSVLLAVALPASALKVFLPGVTGTMSVSYVFVLLGMLDFSYPETVLLACLAMVVQSVGRTKYRPKLLHLAFNLASTAIAVDIRIWNLPSDCGPGTGAAQRRDRLNRVLSDQLSVGRRGGCRSPKARAFARSGTNAICGPSPTIWWVARLRCSSVGATGRWGGERRSRPTGGLRDLPFVPALPGASRIREESR